MNEQTYTPNNNRIYKIMPHRVNQTSKQSACIYTPCTYTSYQVAPVAFVPQNNREDLLTARLGTQFPHHPVDMKLGPSQSARRWHSTPCYRFGKAPVQGRQ